MNAERHYDDERLITLASSDDPAVLSNDLHLRTCRPCADSLATLRDVTTTLSHPDVWSAPLKDSEPHMETVDFLRRKQAQGWVKKLLAAPMEEWPRIIDAHPNWKCDAMVEAMVAEAERTIFATPPEALQLARLAVGASPKCSQHAQFEALREYAFCLYYTGSYPESLRSAERASKLADDEIGSARILLQIALVKIDIGDRTEGLQLARQAAEGFERLGQSGRRLAARRTEAIALYHLRRYRDARDIYTELLSECSNPVDHAGLLQNVAMCYRELGEYSEATKLFVRALEESERIGRAAIAAKTRWHLGRTLLLQGRYGDAFETLTSVGRDFRSMAMLQDAALVTIDIAQVLMVLGSPAEVVDLCREASRFFSSAGMAKSEGALTALALIDEAAISDRLTATVLVAARRELENRSRRPSLFAD